MSEKIYRLHYRGHLRENVSEGELSAAIEQCRCSVRLAQRQGRVLTAALYRADRMLFFYYEALGEQLAVAEPLSLKSDGACAQGSSCGSVCIPESGEDVQTTCVPPDELLAAFAPLLQVWPGQQKDRLWVHMYHIYYHSIPESVEGWKRAAVPEKRRGRIAFLRDDKLFSYIAFHKAIVDEGLLTGDKYQSIALHENILFSYFEEPKTFVNVKNDTSQESRVIGEWMAVNPESHFIHVPEGQGENFCFLPALFALGVEDI